MRAHLEHVVWAIKYLVVEDVKILHEDMDDLSKWSDIKEDVYRSEQDSFESRFVHIFTKATLSPLEV